MKITIPSPYHLPKDESFHELIWLWQKEGLITIDKNTNNQFTSINKNILVNERAIIPGNIGTTLYQQYLFANTVPTQSHGWIFWGRHPQQLELFARQSTSQRKRPIKSIFLGKYHNEAQGAKRLKLDWASAIEHYTLFAQHETPLPIEEYLRKIRASQFGLCLPGKGPKCNREIELASQGTIPIITEGVCTKYFRPLIENVHYIKADTPEEATEKIDTMDNNAIQKMSDNIQQWYWQTSSTEGSFKTTQAMIIHLKKTRSTNLKLHDRLRLLKNFAGQKKLSISNSLKRNPSKSN